MMNKKKGYLKKTWAKKKKTRFAFLISIAE
jgi:hypothetical protein